MNEIPHPMPVPRHGAVGRVLRVASGNMLEMYDFMVFGFYAEIIGATFFPGGSPTTRLLSALATFGAGFAMRPLGAIFLGAFIDRHGRRAGLLATLGLMAVGTLTIACTPGFARIGLAAPLLIVAGRLIQGFSAGAELGGVSVYLAEIAPPGRRGFFASFQSASQQVAVIAAALLGYGLNKGLDHAQMLGWGWRIPFILGCLVIPLLLILRRGLEETEAFENRAQHPSMGEAFGILWRNASTVLTGMMLVAMTTVSFYTITSYTPTFGTHELHLSMSDSLLVTLAVGISNLVLLPVGGALADRFGRRPLLLGCTIAMALLAYPAMLWLVAAPSFGKLLAVELALSLLYALYNGALIVHLSEIMPASLRVTGFSLAYSLATALFGGLTPLICTWGADRFHNPAVPGLWLTAAAAIALLALFLSGRGSNARLHRRQATVRRATAAEPGSLRAVSMPLAG